MIKKILFSVVILTVFIFSCKILDNKNNQEIYFKFSKENQEIKIPIPPTSFKNKNKQKIIEREYSKIIRINTDTSEITSIAYSHKYNTLDFINTDYDILKQIQLPKISRSLSNFKYINKDSVILQYQPNYFTFNHDSCIVLANNKGEIKKIYSLKNSGVFCSENPEMYNNDNSVYLLPNFYEPLAYKKNKVFLIFGRTGYVGDPAFKGIPVAGYIDMKENKFHPIDIEYPDIIYDGKHLFPSHDKRIFSLLAHDGDILYAFKYTPTIFKYNTETGKIKKIQIKSTVFDTIFSFNSEKDFPQGLDFQMPYPEYWLLNYDKENNRYIRKIVLPESYGKFKLLDVIADTTFNVFAEGFLGEKTKKYKEGTNQELIRNIKGMYNRITINKPLTDYVKNFGKIKDKNYTAIFFWIEGSCEKTHEGVLNFYKHFDNYFKQNNTYLFLITNNNENVNGLLKQKELLNYKNKSIYVDSLYRFGAYTNYQILNMPRVIKVRKNKIVADTIFEASPDGSEHFKRFVYDATKEQNELKEK